MVMALIVLLPLCSTPCVGSLKLVNMKTSFTSTLVRPQVLTTPSNCECAQESCVWLSKSPGATSAPSDLSRLNVWCSEHWYPLSVWVGNLPIALLQVSQPFTNQTPCSREPTVALFQLFVSPFCSPQATNWSFTRRAHEPLLVSYSLLLSFLSQRSDPVVCLDGYPGGHCRHLHLPTHQGCGSAENGVQEEVDVVCMCWTWLVCGGGD